MEHVRIGFIGVGSMAEHHMTTLEKMAGVALTAAYDINSSRTEQMAEKFAAKAFTSELELLDSGLIDALYICTPPNTRGQTEMLAVERGIAILSEKPVGLDRETVGKISAAIQKSGVINSSGYCLRYLDTIQKARAYLANKQINMIFGYRMGGLPPAKWFAQMEQSGGQLVEQSTHQVDLIRYLCGEFDEVQAFYTQRSIHTVDEDATIPDAGVISFTMQSGAVGSFMNSCMSNHHGRGDIEIYGDGFYMAINGHSLTIKDDQQEITEVCKTDFYAAQNAAFVEAVRTGRQELVLGSYEEAVATLTLTLAMNESANKKTAVHAV